MVLLLPRLNALGSDILAEDPEVLLISAPAGEGDIVTFIYALTDLAAMGAGVSTDGMRVAGVPVGVDAWVKAFVEKKARSVITVVASSVQDLMPN